MSRLDFRAGAALLVAAVLFGGGSGLFPLQRLVVELVGAGVLLWFAAQGWRARADAWMLSAMLLVILMLLLLLAQLVPLPASTWAALPGREDLLVVAQAVGAAEVARPISIFPTYTVECGAYLIAPVAMFVAVSHLGDGDRVRLAGLISAFGGLAALMGVFQTAGGGLYLFDTTHRGAAVGLFANKNHNADFLLVAMLMLATYVRHAPAHGLRAPSSTVAAGGILLLGLAVLASDSRMGVALAPLAVVPSLLLIAPPSVLNGRGLKLTGLAVLAALAAGASLLLFSGPGARLMLRFNADSEGRFDFWPDVIYAIQRYFPIGSGLGTFVPVFKRDENLAGMALGYVVHAHSDYLEILLEAGVAGLVLMIAAGVLLGWSVFRVVRGSRDFRSTLAVPSLLGIAILLLHSIVDYPLRTLTLSTIFALMVAATAPCSGVPAPGERRGGRRGIEQGVHHTI